MAQPHVRHLDHNGRPADQHDLMAPVELIRLAGLEAQRHEGCARSRALATSPRRTVAPNGIVTALVAEPAQFLEDPHQRDPLAAAACGIGRQHPVELIGKRAELGLWLNVAFVRERRHLGPKDFANRFA